MTSPTPGLSAFPSNTDITKWNATIIGPSGTPYENLTLKLTLSYPPDYPFQPPEVLFKTPVYHPNVDMSGRICLDILKDAWSPVLTLKSTLISLQSLLCSPEPNDPQDAEVAKHYMTSRSSFEETARYWTRIYAGGPAEESKSGQDPVAIAGLEKAHVDRFEALGFPRDKVVSFKGIHDSLFLFE